MKTIQRAIQVACGLSAVAVAPAALADAKPGVYIGVSGGKSSYDIDQEDLNDFTLDLFRFNGYPILAASSSLEDSDTAVALFVGYRFLPYIAVEAGFLDLGTAEYRMRGVVNPLGPIGSAPAAYAIDVETRGFTVAGIGSLPLGNVVDVHGRLGLLIAETELTTAVAITGFVSDRDSDKLEAANAFIGVGAGFHFGEHWSMSVDWVRYDNVGDEDNDDDWETEGGFNVDAWNVSGMFRF